MWCMSTLQKSLAVPYMEIFKDLYTNAFAVHKKQGASLQVADNILEMLLERSQLLKPVTGNAEWCKFAFAV